MKVLVCIWIDKLLFSFAIRFLGAWKTAVVPSIHFLTDTAMSNKERNQRKAEKKGDDFYAENLISVFT